MTTRALGAIVAVLVLSVPARGQGALERLSLSGADSQTGTGALRCRVGEEAQFSLQGTDSSLTAVPLEPYEPVATSSNEKVLIARRASYSAYIVNARCVANGEAWIVVKAGGVETTMPALVGTARSKATPRAPSASSTLPASPTLSASSAPSIASASSASSVPSDRARASTVRPATIDAEERRAPAASALRVEPDAPAVPASGLALFAGYGEVLLSWRPAPGAAGYRIARKDVAANLLEALTGETVFADGRGLVTDTTFVDRHATPGKLYAYYLGTWFRHRDGSYYWPEPGLEARGVATPRDPSGLSWLPADWRDPVTITGVTMKDGSLVLVWRPKFAALSYALSTVIVTAPDPGGACSSSDTHRYDFEISDTTFTKNIVEENSNQSRVTLYCIGIRAMFPMSMANGRPSDPMNNYIAYAAVQRSCPASRSAPCGPWQILRGASIRENQKEHWTRFL